MEADGRTPAASVSYRDVTKRYPGQSSPAINHLSLEIPAGDICVLVGPSGCGKTTAMRMLNRTVEITEGDILIGDTSVRDRDPSELRREMGYVIQQTGLFPHRTVADNIATVPKLVGWDRERTRKRVGELLELIGLDQSEADRFPSQLSGGQQQRVGVARALAADPPVMLMDEPFGAIDPINRERLQNEFLRLQAEIRKTVLFVTHDIDEAIKMGDRIAILKAGGHLAQYATPAELLMAPADDFVEDFVGADRALKRLALMRVRDINLWEAPLAFVGQSTAEIRAKLDGAEVPHALVVDSERHPLGWLSESDLRADTVPREAGQRPRAGPRPRRRDAGRARRPPADRDPVRAGNRRSRPDRRRALRRDHLRVPRLAGGEGRGARRGRAAARAMSPALAQFAPLLAQVTIHNRTGGNAPCQAQQGKVFCFGWAADNFDRYTTPLLNQLLLVLIAVAIGFAIAFAMALISHRRRWLVPSFTGATGVLYTIPSLAFIFLLLPITGLGWTTAIIVLSVYTLQIIYRNTVAGLNNVPVDSKDAGRGMGMTDRQLLWRVELPLALPEIIAGLRIATVSTVAIATLMVFANVNTLGAPLYQQIDFKTNIVIAGGLSILMAIAFDLMLLLAQRLLAPWRRSQKEATP